MFDPISMGLTAGLSLLSGIGGNKAAKKQAKAQAANDKFMREWNMNEQRAADSYNEDLGRALVNTPHTQDVQSSQRGGVDVDAMMLAADRAGFNPVTWLNAGAMQAYGYTLNSSSTVETGGQNAIDGYRMMMHTPSLMSQATQAPLLKDPLQMVGDAGQKALDYFRTDQARTDTQNFQMSYLDRQLSAIAAGKKSTGLGDTPRVTSAGSAVSSSPGASDMGFFGSSNWMTPKLKQSERTAMPNDYISNPNVPDYQSVQDRYGPLLGGIYGLGGDVSHLYYGGSKYLTGTARDLSTDMSSAWDMMSNPARGLSMRNIGQGFRGLGAVDLMAPFKYSDPSPGFIYGD